MLGEAKGTAWPESCWSLVTCAGGEGQRSEGAEVGGGLLREGVLQAGVTHLSWGHSPVLTLDGEALWGRRRPRAKGLLGQVRAVPPPWTPNSSFHPPLFQQAPLTWLAERRTVPKERLGWYGMVAPLGGDWKDRRGSCQDPPGRPELTGVLCAKALPTAPRNTHRPSWGVLARGRGLSRPPPPPPCAPSPAPGSTSRMTAQIWRTHRMMASGTPDTVTARSVELGSRSPATCTWAPVVCRRRGGHCQLPARGGLALRAARGGAGGRDFGVVSPPQPPPLGSP